MITRGYRYKFLSIAALQEAEKTLILATLAAVGLHGESRVRMDAAYTVDDARFVIAVDTSTVVGEDIACIFTAFIATEFGQGQFLVRPMWQEDHV